jgi:hypothetical protein
VLVASSCSPSLSHCFEVPFPILFVSKEGDHRSPFLVVLIPPYSTTYIGQIMAQQYDKEPDKDLATRTGALAMLIHSIGTTCALKIVRFKADLRVS